jgi:hypothetical protein
MLKTWHTAPHGGVAHHNETAVQLAIAEDAAFTIVLAQVFNLDREPLEDENCIFKVKTTLRERLDAFGRIVACPHLVNVST